MNKFKYLQVVGTTIVFSPIILLGVTVGIFQSTKFSSEESTSDIVEVVAETKKDTIVVVEKLPEEIKPVVKPTPIEPVKVVVKDTLSKVVVRKDTLQKDTIEKKLEVQIDTTKKL
jgi:hypothetical protein